MVTASEGGPCPRMLEAERVMSNTPGDDEQAVLGILIMYSQEPSFTHDKFRENFSVVCEYEML